MSTRHYLRDYDRRRVARQLEASLSAIIVTAAMYVSKIIFSRSKKAAEGGNAMQKAPGFVNHTSAKGLKGEEPF
ncbi:hypothetical protein TNCV_1242431 [Trichonephila clavipes]|nr:hypothetical protein TNCV_1242431 [Trichonephila clavipes]